MAKLHKLSLTLPSAVFLAAVFSVNAFTMAQVPALVAPSLELPTAPPTTDSEENLPDPNPLDDASIAQFIRSLALAHLPSRYVDEKQWGKTKSVWNGVKVSLDGLRVDSERRTKVVNHGTWKRYEIHLADHPAPLQLSIDNVHQTEDSRLRFDVIAVARLKLFGRFAQWERGVQLVSVGAEADATARLTSTCDFAIDLDTGKIPPDVLLKPKVTAARVELLDFRLRRVGDLDGPVVRQLGHSLREVLDDRLAKENERLADRLNRQIAKKQDKLRLSLHDWLAKKIGAAP